MALTTADPRLASRPALVGSLALLDESPGQGVALTKFGADHADLRPIYVNDAFARIVGRPADEITGPSFFLANLFDPAERERLARELPLSDLDADLRYETTIVRPDGSRVSVEIASSRLQLDGDDHRLVILRDITRAKQVAKTQRSRDGFLRDATLALIEHGLDPEQTLRVAVRLATQHLADYAHVDLLDADGIRRVVVAAADPEMRQRLEAYHARFPAKERARLALDRIPAGEAYVGNYLPRALLERDHGPEEMRELDALGIRHVLLVPLVGRGGRAGGIGFTRSREQPFTPEEIFLAKSLATRVALAYENARLYAHYQRILDTAPVQILTIDEGGRILSLNRSVRGQDPGVALGLNAFDAVVDEDRERVRDIIRHVMRTGEKGEYETRAVLGPGVARWFHVRAGALDLGGKPGAILISTDIEDKKRAERELAEARAELLSGEKLAALGGLVSGVAHELRTPLTYLANNAYLLQRRLVAAAASGLTVAQTLPSLEPYLSEIDEGVDRIDGLVEDLRKYTKARRDATMDVLSLDAFLTEAIEIFRATNRASHPVERALSPTRPVRANRGAVQQLALNLLQNAAEASPAGTLVRIVTRQDGDRAILEVIDQGAGISQEVRERMFEPLFTTKEDGTGLGLTIVRRIADDHRAQIQVESTIGVGTTFRIVFPATV